MKRCASAERDNPAALAKDIRVLLYRSNTAGPASLVVPAEYLEVVIERE